MQYGNEKKRINAEQVRPLVGGAITRARGLRYAMPAPLATQIMTERARGRGRQVLAGPARNPALEAYSQGASVTERRLPTGFAHAEDV